MTINSTEGHAEAKGTSPPYIPYLTFKNFIQWLEVDGIPLQFDRTAWEKKYSGSTGPQLLTALRFLGLLREERPTPELERVIEVRGEDRKNLLRDVLKDAYTAVNFEELPRATPGMLRTWMMSFGIEGDTVRKAESFFVNAAKDLDIPLSPNLRKLARNRAPGTIKQATRRDPKPQQSSNRVNPAENEENHYPVIPTELDKADAQSSLMLWGLFKRLPPPRSEFSGHEREAWLEAAKTLFNLEYQDGKEV